MMTFRGHLGTLCALYLQNVGYFLKIDEVGPCVLGADSRPLAHYHIMSPSVAWTRMRMPAHRLPFGVPFCIYWTGLNEAMQRSDYALG